VGKMKKKAKEYNARGERMYENMIKRENAKKKKKKKKKKKTKKKKNKKNKIKQDEKYKSE